MEFLNTIGGGALALLGAALNRFVLIALPRRFARRRAAPGLSPGRPRRGPGLLGPALHMRSPGCFMICHVDLSSLF